MAISTSVVQVNDSVIKRDRFSRTMFFFLSPVLLVVVEALLTGMLSKIFLGDVFFNIGLVIGAVLGFVSFLASKHLFVVENNTTGLLVTLDRLKSLLGAKDVDVIYGPGTHLSFPWEARFAENNIPITEVAEEFSFPVMCKDGTLTISASFRLRPDFENPINYLSGVGAADKDFKALQIAAITKRLHQKTMQGALDGSETLNQELHGEFAGSGVTDFEKRFGVRVGDVTVSNMLMSDEAQRTRTALNEASVVSQGTAILLGYKTIEEAMSAGIAQDVIDRARREFRIISGNMDGAEVKRYEVDISGLSPEAATAISSLLKNPAAQAFLAAGQGGKSQPKKGK
jgi:regulator of protease activity HflC (stomatin/prohibitin superfamily)